MNEYNNESNARPITPYKATGNLNTAIGNPSVNINDTMNVNIQSMSTGNGVGQPVNYINTLQEQHIQSNNVGNITINNQNTQNTSIPGPQNVVTNTPVNNIHVGSTMDANSTYINTNQTVNNETVNNQSGIGVQRTYVTMDNKPKKKTLSISLGPEFKMGLLIIVILLVFVLFLPMISDLLNGY